MKRKVLLSLFALLPILASAQLPGNTVSSAWRAMQRKADSMARALDSMLHVYALRSKATSDSVMWRGLWNGLQTGINTLTGGLATANISLLNTNSNVSGLATRMSAAESGLSMARATANHGDSVAGVAMASIGATMASLATTNTTVSTLAGTVNSNYTALSGMIAALKSTDSSNHKADSTLADGKVPQTRTLTFNGDTKTLAANASWTITIPTTDSVQFFGTSGRIRQKMKVFQGIYTPTVAGGYSCDISAAGFSTITNVQLTAGNNTAVATSSPQVSYKSYTTSAVLINVTMSNNATIASLLQPIIGLIFPASVSGVTIHLTVTGY